MVKFYACIWEVLREFRGSVSVGGAATSIHIGDAMVARAGRGAPLDAESDATPTCVDRKRVRFRSGAARRARARSPTIVDRREIDARHADYFDGEWERP